jgi:hypothetical protein
MPQAGAWHAACKRHVRASEDYVLQTQRPDDLLEALADVARTVSKLVGARADRLAAVTITVPCEYATGPVEELLEQRLSDFGLDAVDVHLVRRPGPVRLVSTEFEAS